MTAGTVSPGARALAYAENELGVHHAYTAAQNAREQLDEALSALSDARDKQRDLRLRLEDAEMDVAIDERGKHPEMSQAQMDKHLKMSLFKNDLVRELREQVAKVTGDVEGLEFDKTVHEADIRIAVARMQELGGYLQYLAAIKSSETARLASEAKESTT